MFVSAEHGDGLQDLFDRIEKLIPPEKHGQYIDRKEKRIERYIEYKNMLLDEIVEMKKEEINKTLSKDDEELDAEEFEEDLAQFVRTWEKEFDDVNAVVPPEENSDFDSDNDINPLDQIDSLGHYSSSRVQITSENPMKRRPVQLSIIGKPNVGKSTLVNSLLMEQRVIANDLEGTTRDAVRVQWQYAGRRIILVDTAGIKHGKAHKVMVDAML